MSCPSGVPGLFVAVVFLRFDQEENTSGGQPKKIHRKTHFSPPRFPASIPNAIQPMPIAARLKHMKRDNPLTSTFFFCSADIVL